MLHLRHGDAPGGWKSRADCGTGMSLVIEILNRCFDGVGVAVRSNAGVGVAVDVCVSLASGLSDGVAVTVAAGVGVGPSVAVIGCTV
jgi:hypothetical protein